MNGQLGLIAGSAGGRKSGRMSTFAAAFEAKFRRTARTLTALVGRPDNRQTLAYAPRTTQILLKICRLFPRRKRITNHHTSLGRQP